MEITYKQVGEYLIPDLTLTDTEATYGKYGRMRKRYLQERRKALYSRLLLSGGLTEHLNEIDRTAREQVEQTVKAMLQTSPPPDKATDPLGWTGHVNSLKHQAEELVYSELIYA